jgi:hypothetical protein
MTSDRIVAFVNAVAEAEKIGPVTVLFHEHKNRCFDGEADMDARAITFCAKRDRLTALHELAHIATQEAHTRKWAKFLFIINERYITEQRALRANRAAAIDYAKARRLYKEKYGVPPPQSPGLSRRLVGR